MLELANAPGGIKQVHLMHQTGISYPSMKRHLSYLMQAGMVERVVVAVPPTGERRRAAEAVIYRTTQIGRRFLQNYRELLETIMTNNEGTVEKKKQKPFLELIDEWQL